eukprot:12221-Rhodomonas_salina.3
MNDGHRSDGGDTEGSNGVDAGSMPVARVFTPSTRFSSSVVENDPGFRFAWLAEHDVTMTQGLRAIKTDKMSLNP